jgi:N-methylhydantoinase B
MAGGGGYGDPRERDPERVLADVREEKITVARARAAYGVVIDAETLELDRDGTARERGVQAQGGGETDE